MRKLAAADEHCDGCVKRCSKLVENVRSRLGDCNAGQYVEGAEPRYNHLQVKHMILHCLRGCVTLVTAAAAAPCQTISHALVHDHRSRCVPVCD